MMQKKFSIGISNPQKIKKPSILFFVYALLFLVAFRCFSLYSNVTNILFGNSALDIFTKDLQTLSVYFLPIDKNVSHELYVLDEIVQSYMNGENIFKTKKSEIEEVRSYVINNKNYLSRLGFNHYDSLMGFMSDIYDQRETIYDLLGENQSYNYLIPLQNGNEKRPNGGFFGSFAFVTISGGHIQDLEVIDSYLADYISPDTRIDLPSRYTNSFGEKQLGFVAGNKFGFTDMDGKNLKILYEKSFNENYDMDRVREMYDENQWRLLHDKYIKGVFFLDSNLLTELLPGFENKMREWQFVNASIDIIRGEDRSNKKEIYISQVLDYFFNNTKTIAKNLVNNRDDVLNKRYIQIYLSASVNESFRNMLHQYNLNTRYDPNTIYARDVNTANNKSDGFMSKKIRLYSGTGDLLLTQSTEVISLENLPGGDYQLVIDYDFFVPDRYKKYIGSLASKYNITITSREEGILVTGPINHYGATTNRYREDRGMIYYPWNMTIKSIEGNAQNISYFQSDFSNGLNYTVYTDKTQDQIQVVINFSIDK